MKMKTLLFIFSVFALASCSTAYKSGQTPDDLYFSKGKLIEDVATRTDVRDDAYEDRQIRMAAHDARWRTIDDRDYNYRYDPYNYGKNFDYFYNPYSYYYPYGVYSPGMIYTVPKNSTIRTTNLNAYRNTISTYTPTKGSGNGKTITERRYNNSNSNTERNNSYETRSYDTKSYNPPANTNTTNSNSSSGSSITRPRKEN